MKYWFKNDYSFGAHPKVLDAIVKANLEGNKGYGFDKYSDKAKLLIKEKCDLPNSHVEKPDLPIREIAKGQLKVPSFLFFPRHTFHLFL